MCIVISLITILCGRLLKMTNAVSIKTIHMKVLLRVRPPESDNKGGPLQTTGK